jgi:hypothetical protein
LVQLITSETAPRVSASFISPPNQSARLWMEPLDLGVAFRVGNLKLQVWAPGPSRAFRAAVYAAWIARPALEIIFRVDTPFDMARQLVGFGVLAGGGKCSRRSHSKLQEYRRVRSCAPYESFYFVIRINLLDYGFFVCCQAFLKNLCGRPSYRGMGILPTS